MPDEDKKLLELIESYGPSRWSMIASFMPGREGKQCRERWHNHLNPVIMKECWTDEEDLRLFLLYKLYGSKWSVLSFMFSGRTDNSIKNHWNSIMKKKIRRFEAYIKGVLESGNYSGLCALDIDLIERMKRSEFDNKSCRKGRTRDYAGFFQKNGLTHFVKGTESEPQLNNGDCDEDFDAMEDLVLAGRETKLESFQPPKGPAPAQIGDQSSLILNKNDSFSAVRGVLKENLDLMAQKVDQLATKLLFHEIGSSGFHEPESRLQKIHPEFKTDQKRTVFPSKMLIELTPNSVLSKEDRNCNLQTTANGHKNDGLLPTGPNLCLTSFFACHEHSVRPSPMPFANQSVYSSESIRDNCLNQFRTLLTPTKRMFDFSNRKFFNSRSSNKDASVFSNLKSLNISKSLEYN
jgi:hypothetical protein